MKKAILGDTVSPVNVVKWVLKWVFTVRYFFDGSDMIEVHPKVQPKAVIYFLVYIPPGPNYMTHTGSQNVKLLFDSI